ncbi:Pyridine nucleotide-disulphide oxidoreductase [Melghirimyces thermohalophilus]|uniref:Pyridine nucleotide-disulphide oxidoreductase n=1 Tax=Melghirimyces thermohalophilus TaxID=1236220 RepID=A0A1G6L7Q0_9BACL|nr:Pyridine nucleotide-disulphide oxidoreductase [Melghirimyces thermohalophilus]
MEKKEDGFELVTDRQTHFTKTIVITAGVGAFEPRKLIVSGAERFEGQNLHYFVEDVQQFAGKRVLVAGGGDSAVDWANTLERIASQVTLIHRRDRFRAHESSVEQLKQSSVQVITPSSDPIPARGEEDRTGGVGGSEYQGDGIHRRG